MIALLILTTYFPRLERGARFSPTLGPHVFQTTTFKVLKVLSDLAVVAMRIITPAF